MTPRARWLAIATLALLPLVWLWPSVFGDRTFVPYDLAEFPPASLSLPADEVAAMRQRANHDVTEVPVWFLPEMELARDELLAGRWPAWNPHSRGGTPLHAHGLIGLCHPPNWLALFAADPGSRLGLVAWINLALGGLLAFGLLRELGIGMFAAWFGAAVFELSAPMATNAFFWMRLASFVWLPGVMWSLLRLANCTSLRPGPLAAVAGSFAGAWLGGFPPFATTTSVIGGLWCAWLVGARAREGGARAASSVALRCGAALVLGAMLAMPQVLPSLRFFPESARDPNPTRAQIAQQSFESYGLLGYLAPDLISHPTAVHEIPYGQSPLALLLNTRDESPGKAALPNYNYTEYAVFVGTFGLLLAIAGVFAGRGRHRGFAVGTYALLLGLALFVPVVNLLFHLPVIKNVWPMRWLAPATLFVCWLAALGVERFRDTRVPLPRILVPLAIGVLAVALAVFLSLRIGVLYSPSVSPGADPAIAARYQCSEQAVIDHVQGGVPLATMDRFAIARERAFDQSGQARSWLWIAAGWSLVVGLVWSARWRTWLVGAAAIATLLQLALHGAPIVRGCELTHPTDSAVHTFLRERAAAAAPDGGFTIVRGSMAPTLPVQLPPGELMAPGLRDLHFYTHYDGRSHQPLVAMLGEYGERIAGKGYLVQSLPDAILAHPLLDLLSVRYVLALENLQHAGARVGPSVKGPHGELLVFERPTALPRAFTVPALRALPTDADVVKALADPTLQPRAAALVLASDVPAGARAAPADTPSRTVRFITNLPTVVELDVGAGNAPWLVLADTFLPGWTATIEGEPATILRANHAQRALAIPDRACKVRFAYATPGLTAGFALAGIATLVLLASLARHRRRVHAGAAV